MGLWAILVMSWRNCAENTSISGAANAARSRHPCRRFWWSLVFLAMLAATIWAVYTVMADYLGYPVDTTITLKHFNRVRNLCDLTGNRAHLTFADHVSCGDRVQPEQGGLWEAARLGGGL